LDGERECGEAGGPRWGEPECEFEGEDECERSVLEEFDLEAPGLLRAKMPPRKDMGRFCV
jgi:hypothetical protein